MMGGPMIVPAIRLPEGVVPAGVHCEEGRVDLRLISSWGIMAVCTAHLDGTDVADWSLGPAAGTGIDSLNRAVREFFVGTESHDSRGLFQALPAAWPYEGGLA